MPGDKTSLQNISANARRQNISTKHHCKFQEAKHLYKTSLQMPGGKTSLQNLSANARRQNHWTKPLDKSIT